MVSAFHGKQIVSQGIHTMKAYDYATIAAMNSATGFTSEDIGKVAQVAADGSFWILANTSPFWIEFSTAGQTLQKVLSIGNETDGYDIVVSSGDSILFGANPAISAVIGLSNNTGIYFKDFAGATDINLIRSDGLNNVLISSADGYNIFLGTVQWQANPGLGSSQDGYVPVWVNADGLVKWKPNQPIITLSGDVSGLSNANTVDKLKNIPLSIPAHGAAQDGYVLTFVNGSSDLELKPTGLATLTLAGDVTGLYSANTVAKIHGAPVTTIGASNTLLGTTDGVNLTYFHINLASSQVTGVLPIGNQANQNMVGDVSGTTGANTVDKIKGKSLATSVGTVGAAQDGYALIWNNSATAWTPTQISGSSTLVIAGDVTGTLAATTVVKLQNRNLSSSAPTDGCAIIYNSGASTWTVDGSHFLDLAGQYLKFGGGSAASGSIRLPNLSFINWRNVAGTADVTAVQIDNGDNLVLGDRNNATAVYLDAKTGGSQVLRVNGTTEYTFNASNALFSTNNLITDGYIAVTSTGMSAQGSIRSKASPGNLGYWFRNNAGSADICALFSGTDDVTYVGDGNNTVGVSLRSGSGGFAQIIINSSTEYNFNSTRADFRDNHLSFGLAGTQATDGYINFTQNAGRLISAENYDATGTQNILSISGSGTFSDLHIGDDGSKGTNSTYLQAKAQVVASISAVQIANFGAGGLTMFPSSNPATSGVIRLTNNTGMWSRNASNTNNINLITSDASDHIVIGIGSGSSTNYYNTATAGSHIFQVNAVDEYTFNATNALFSTNNIITDGYIALSTTAPATSGAIRLANAASIVGRNSLNNADYPLIFAGSDNYVTIGDSNNGGIKLNSAVGNQIKFQHNSSDSYVFSNSQADFKANNIITTGFMSVGGSTPAASGAIRLPNNTTINARNAANSADVNVIQCTGSNNIIVGDITNPPELSLECTTDIGFYIGSSTRRAQMDTAKMDFKTLYLAMQQQSEPAAPAAGWVIYVRNADGKLCARASTGTIVVLGTP